MIVRDVEGPVLRVVEELHEQEPVVPVAGELQVAVALVVPVVAMALVVVVVMAMVFAVP